MGLEETVSSLLVGISGQREEQKKLISGLTCLEEKGTTSLTQASAASCQVWYVHKVCGEDSVLSTQSTQPAFFRSCPCEDFLTVHSTWPSPGTSIPHLVLGRLLWQERVSQGPRPVDVGNHHCMQPRTWLFPTHPSAEHTEALWCLISKATAAHNYLLRQLQCHLR